MEALHRLIGFCEQLQGDEASRVQDQSIFVGFQYRNGVNEFFGSGIVSRLHPWLKFELNVRCYSATHVCDEHRAVGFVRQLGEVRDELWLRGSYVCVVFLVGDEGCNEGNQKSTERPPGLPVGIAACYPLVGERSGAEES